MLKEVERKPENIMSELTEKKMSEPMRVNGERKTREWNEKQSDDKSVARKWREIRKNLSKEIEEKAIKESRLLNG